jgi:hypothetical protein
VSVANMAETMAVVPVDEAAYTTLRLWGKLIDCARKRPGTVLEFDFFLKTGVGRLGLLNVETAGGVSAANVAKIRAVIPVDEAASQILRMCGKLMDCAGNRTLLLTSFGVFFSEYACNSKSNIDFHGRWNI